MGRGYSGSTILDILLGNSSQIESVGQLLSGMRRADREVCSCGATMPDCLFWRKVRGRVEAEGIAWDEACRIEDLGVTGLWRVWYAGNTDPAVARRAQITRTLSRAITACAGKPHLLDSSKTPTHGLLLLRHLPEARLIHLVRDPRYVLRSYVWRIRHHEHFGISLGRLARGNVPLFLVSVAATWTGVNFVCDLMARAFPGRVMRVCFEDLCARPTGELDRIGRALGLDLAEVSNKAAAQEPLVVGHNVAGNRVRHADTVRFDPSGGPARPPLPSWLEAVIILLCGPLMWRYGYRLSWRRLLDWRFGARAREMKADKRVARPWPR
jgi:Sulfotransferase family